MLWDLCLILLLVLGSLQASKLRGVRPIVCGGRDQLSRAALLQERDRRKVGLEVFW
jgi:hypothetical protein